VFDPGLAQDKKVRHLGAEIVFEDGFAYAEPVSFTWAPKGQTPQIKRITKYCRDTLAMVALTISGEDLQTTF
jgi:hypothetical protein